MKQLKTILVGFIFVIGGFSMASASDNSNIHENSISDKEILLDKAIEKINNTIQYNTTQQ